MTFKLLLQKYKTYIRIGVINILRVGIYKSALKFGVHPVQRIRPEPMPLLSRVPVFFSPPRCFRAGLTAPEAWQDHGTLFDIFSINLGKRPPEWFKNYLTNKYFPGDRRPWWAIPDFDPDFGDIKNVWELSRWHWLVAMAQRVMLGDMVSLKSINTWLLDWCNHNPAFLGPNWKCGQEASLRIIHLATAAMILEEEHIVSDMIAFVLKNHLIRIAPTISYAIGQNNNHGTSEAVGLFVGGSWLYTTKSDKSAQQYMLMGRKILEERVHSLVSSDGSFSQYSVNYHRMMIDSLSVAEIWRRRLSLPRFSDSFYVKAAAATRWLVAMTDAITGDAPNIGANDGARLIPLGNTGYRDFRPSGQLAAALFLEQSAFNEGPHDEVLEWFRLSKSPERLDLPETILFDDGGYAILSKGDAKAMIRYPRFDFRPSQNDALHLDLWIAGHNLLRDGGTYSYNEGKEWNAYFGGNTAHNLVTFDKGDQMPRISRFLLGSWLETRERKMFSKNGEASHRFYASYLDYKNRYHCRDIELSNKTLLVKDTVKDFKREACLRWRLAPGKWILEGNRISNGKFSLTLSANNDVKIDLVKGFESRHYQHKNIIPVVEARVFEPSILTTLVKWQ